MSARDCRGFNELGEKRLIGAEAAKGGLPSGYHLFQEQLILLIEPFLQAGPEGIVLGLIHGVGVAHLGLGEG